MGGYRFELPVKPRWFVTCKGRNAKHGHEISFAVRADTPAEARAEYSRAMEQANMLRSEWVVKAHMEV